MSVFERVEHFFKGVLPQMERFGVKMTVRRASSRRRCTTLHTVHRDRQEKFGNKIPLFAAHCAQNVSKIGK